MRQIILAMASCLVWAAAAAQSRPDAAVTTSADAPAAAVDAGTPDHPPVSKARRAVANFTSLLREAALQAQAAQSRSAAASAGTPMQAEPTSDSAPRDVEQAPPRRAVATSPS